MWSVICIYDEHNCEIFKFGVSVEAKMCEVFRYLTTKRIEIKADDDECDGVWNGCTIIPTDTIRKTRKFTSHRLLHANLACVRVVCGV